MSTKNLARTVIEGGRSSEDKYNRRTSLRYWRHNNRTYCRGMVDGSIDWEEEVTPARDVPYRFKSEIHADKTNPCKRFIASKAGQHWDDVYSEICRKFDKKTLPGRHIVEDHLVGYVDRPLAPPYPSRYLFTILDYARGGTWLDANGILNYRQDRHHSYWKQEPRTKTVEELKKWTRGRRAVRVGGVLRWFTASNRWKWKRCSHCSGGYYAYPNMADECHFWETVTKYSSPREVSFSGADLMNISHLKPLGWRQGPELLDREVREYEALNSYEKNLVGLPDDHR